MVQYEIFTIEINGIAKNDAIDSLFEYPNPATETDRYRGTSDDPLIKKYDANLWAGIVNTHLTDACASMTPAERAIYYNDSDLKNDQYLIDNGWYAP